jgi:FolB domain-containing protein
MDHIISDLEVAYRVGVPEVERATPQRLLLSLDLEVDFVDRAASDDLDHTIDYYAVTRRCSSMAKVGVGA